MRLWSSFFSDSLGLLKATLHRRKKLPRHKELLPIRSKKKTTYMYARLFEEKIFRGYKISESYMQHGCAGEALSNISYFRWVAGVQVLMLDNSHQYRENTTELPVST